MTVRVSFYALRTQSLLEALPKLLEKIIGSGHRVLLVNDNPLMLEELDRVLWTYSTRSFLPHGRLGAGFEDQQPLLLSPTLEGLGDRQVLVLTSPFPLSQILRLAPPRVVDMFDGTSAEALSQALNRREEYQKAACETTLWTQTPQGAWEQPV